MTKMTNNRRMTKQSAFKRLAGEYDEIKQRSKNAYNERVYMNLPVTRLERVFFGLLADRLMLDKTKLMRRIIGTFMNKYPFIVQEAKELIDANSDVECW